MVQHSPAGAWLTGAAHVQVQYGASQEDEEAGALLHIMVAVSQTKPVSHSIVLLSSQHGSVSPPQSARFAVSGVAPRLVAVQPARC